uniref:Large ribosomal subunit protein uL4m n=1 Tax=Haptolina ericina TaxID=156174 RepID=A0A7S3BSR1_9EUKA
MRISPPSGGSIRGMARAMGQPLEKATRVVPQSARRPFQQKNRRRDDVLLPRLPPAVPSESGGIVQAWLSSWDATRLGIVELRADVWDMPLRTDIVHRVVFWQRACMRQGTAKTKARAEVRGGGRKPRPQKGTGRSRQGSIRAPQFRGGGRAHPKRPRDHAYHLPQKVVSLGLKVALSDKYRRGALVVLDSTSLDVHKTAGLRQKLDALGIDPRTHRVLILGSNDSSDAGQAKMHIAAANLEFVTSQVAAQANVYDLVRHHLLVIGMDTLIELEQRFDHPQSTGHVEQIQR